MKDIMMVMKIGVYGLGRFGAFWAKLLSQKFTVSGYSRNSSRETPKGVARVSEEEVLQTDVLFLCVSISAMDTVTKQIAPMLKKGCLVVDTCSVKVHPVMVMKENLPDTVDILGTHPMFGPDSGSNGVSGLPLVFSPIRMSEEREKYWLSLFRDFYQLKVFEMTPDEHDKEAAYTQGITHFIGRVLADLKLQKSDIGTVGYNELLKIIEQTCNDPFQLFIDLQKYNPHTFEMRRDLKTSINRFLDILDT
ncbi:MAG: prephenate dehydrogenase/arogenate dehydrogenase family protein [Spirochaetia bacterium]